MFVYFCQIFLYIFFFFWRQIFLYIIYRLTTNTNIGGHHLAHFVIMILASSTNYIGRLQKNTVLVECYT